MGGELDHDPVPDVAPFGVMPQGFGDERDTAHEAEGFVEIGEAQFPVQLAVHQAPPG